MKLQGVDSPILIQSSNIELGTALTMHCREKIELTGGKLFGRINECEVHFRKEGSMTACSIRMKVGALRPWAAEMTHHNPYRAFNNALAKVAAQMRRAKTAIRDEHGTRLDKNLGIARPIITTRGGPLLTPNEDDGAADTPIPEADAYMKAEIQAANQERRSIRSAREILTLKDRPTKVPEAAE